jgi:hypothetical protein
MTCGLVVLSIGNGVRRLGSAGTAVAGGLGLGVLKMMLRRQTGRKGAIGAGIHENNAPPR